MFISGNPKSLTSLVEAISHPRLSNYRSFFSTVGDAQALGVYQWNEELSGALFRVISLVEVVLRNQFHKALGSRYGVVGTAGSRDWYQHIGLNQLSRQKIKEITHHKPHGGTWLPRVPARSPDDVVSKLTFGFWPHLLDVPADSLGNNIPWDSIILDVLPGHRQRQRTYWAKQASKDAFFARMDLCNELRNRIAHHEPVWKLGALMEESRARLHSPLVQVLPAPVTPADAVDRLHLYYDRLSELLHWLSPALAQAYKGSEIDIQCKSLLSAGAVENHKHQRLAGTVDIKNFAGKKRLRKLLRYASRKRQPLTIKNGTVVLGHWSCPATP